MNRIYKIQRKKYIYNLLGLCHICGPHSGCNQTNRFKGNRNWKQYRKNQYKQ